MSDPFDIHGTRWQVSPDLLGILSQEGAIRSINPAWHRVLGHDPTAVVERPLLEFVHPDDVPAARDALDRVRDGAPILQFENRFRHVDGSYRWLAWNAMPEDTHVFCSARDITEAKHVSADLRAQVSEGRLRDEFMAVLGHDLRNPLAAVISALRIARRDPGDARAREVLGMAEQAALRMSGLIDDLLDFERARLGGDIGIRPLSSVPLRAIVAQAVSELRATHPGVEIVEACDHADPLTCDPGRIAQLVSNLAGNAVTHGDPRRGIRVATRDEGPMVVLSVTNHGPTIPPDLLARIFDPFSRAEDATPRSGLGLGLYICRSIARAHGGRLEVASEDGLTTFTLRLPRMPGLPADRRLS